MNVIKRLPPDIVARIAAGEVVERPASVLKELVENALDAGASRIAADIESGGIAKLRVSDDGAGMTPDDLSLAVQPHATSKLHDADQLHTLETLGFRGEALPSIASVSRFSIVSRKRPASTSPSESTSSEDSMAWRIDVEGGRPDVPEPRPASGPFGTTVEARELFYNLPARQKFLKGLAAEASACADTFMRLALTRPDVAFTLKQGRSELVALAATTASPTRSSRSAQTAPDLPAAAYIRRAREALGTSQSDGLIAVDFSDGPQTPALSDDLAEGSVHPYRLYGLLSPPAVTRPNRAAIYLTVNGRAVKDRTLTSALLESFRHLLPPKRFPVAVLYLELPGSDVDINVHPAKSEVRFRLPSRIYALFYHAVRSACGMASRSEPSDLDTSSLPNTGGALDRDSFPRLAPGSNANSFTSYKSSSPVKFSPDPYRPNRSNHSTASSWPIIAPISAKLHGSPATSKFQSIPGPIARPDLVADLKFQPSGPLFSEPFPSLPSDLSLWPKALSTEASVALADDPDSSASSVNEPDPAPYGSAAINPASSPASDFRVIGQAAGSYIIIEDESGVRLIDQHALHERILFERLLHAAHAKSRGDSQGLLVPETVDLSSAQAALISSDSETIDLLSHLGFDCEPFGSRALLIRAIPAIVKSTAPGRLVSDLLEALAAGDDAPNGGTKALKRWTLREKAAYILSCKAAIKAGERLTHDQMDALISEFQTVAGPLRASALTCPHGRPLALEISWYELEKAVGRK
ncbi:MAG: DNA mismatch repair endonuclease MutL [Planctomycetota bacterium]